MLGQLAGFERGGGWLVYINALAWLIAIAVLVERLVSLRIIRSRLAYAQNDRALAGAVEKIVVEVLPTVEKRAAYLWFVANVAIVTGLLGAFFGAIGVARAVWLTDPTLDRSTLSKPIMLAVNNTAFGIFVALFSFTAFAVVTGLTNKLAADTLRRSSAAQ